MEVFRVALDNIKERKGETIISVIENFLCDVVRDITDPEEMNSALENSVKESLALIKNTLEKNLEVKFAVANMTQRPLHQWFTDCHDVVCKRIADCKRIAEGVRIMDMGNVGRIKGPIKMSQVFEEDGVHLTASSGRVFVNALLYNADTFFNKEIIHLDEDMEVSGTERNGGTESDQDKNTKRITLVEREIENLKEDIIRRREEDCLVTARMQEELDFFSNTRKENMIIVTGLTSTIPMPVTVEEKKKWLKNVVGEVLNQVEEGASGHILNVIQGWNGRTNFPLAEVRMDSGGFGNKD
jgi:hypothetical protein